MDLWAAVPARRGRRRSRRSPTGASRSGRSSFSGEIYHWSKHLEFLKFIDLPRRCDQPFELALVNARRRGSADARRRTAGACAMPRRSAATSTPIAQYIGQSRGEFTVAKDQNVRLRSGWFSDRSASYLACGRPVITQETGFSNILPTGEGLFAFSTLEEIEEAVERINSRLRAALSTRRARDRARVVRLSRGAGRDARPPRLQAAARGGERLSMTPEPFRRPRAGAGLALADDAARTQSMRAVLGRAGRDRVRAARRRRASARQHRRWSPTTGWSSRGCVSRACSPPTRRSISKSSSSTTRPPMARRDTCATSRGCDARVRVDLYATTTPASRGDESGRRAVARRRHRLPQQRHHSGRPDGWTGSSRISATNGSACSGR